MTVLIVINDAPYGSEGPSNALSLAEALLAEGIIDLRLFFLADGVGCVKARQEVPAGRGNIQRLLQSLAERDVRIGACGSCLDARRLATTDLVPGAARSSMQEFRTTSGSR